MKTLPAFLILSALSGAASAHPGEHHSGFVQGLLHQVSSADHMLLLLGLMVVVGAAIRAGRALRAALRPGNKTDAVNSSAASATKAPL